MGGALLNIDPTTAINQLVKEIRELGTHNSHPTTIMYCDPKYNLLKEKVAVYSDVKQALQEAFSAKVVTLEQYEDASVLLEILNKIYTDSGSTGAFLSNV